MSVRVSDVCTCPRVASARVLAKIEQTVWLHIADTYIVFPCFFVSYKYIYYFEVIPFLLDFITTFFEYVYIHIHICI